MSAGGSPEPAPPPPTCLSWALWGIFRRPLWCRWTQPLSSSASLGKQGGGHLRARPRLPLSSPTHRGDRAQRASASASEDSQAIGGGASGQQGRHPSCDSPTPQGLSSVEVPAIRGEEELVQVSQQQLLGGPREGCQVPGVKEGGGDDQGCPALPPSSVAEQCRLPTKWRVNLEGWGDPLSTPKRGASAHLKLGRPAGLGWGSSRPWEGRRGGSAGSCAENSSKCLRGRGSSLLVRGEMGAGGGSLMLRAGEDGAQRRIPALLRGWFRVKALQTSTYSQPVL